MHELSIMQTLLDQLIVLAKQHQLKRIQKVVIQIGDFRQCVPEILYFAFETVTEGTLAEQAQLVIEFLPIQMECLNCHHVFTVKKHVFLCPQCQQSQLKILSGKEFILSSIEGEQ